jgi:serine/threonine protein kinase
VCRTCCLMPTSISSSSTLARPRASAPTNTVRAAPPNYARATVHRYIHTCRLSLLFRSSFDVFRRNGGVRPARATERALLRQEVRMSRVCRVVLCARVTHKHRRNSSDLWALSCVLYQFLAGKSPFRGANDYKTFRRIKKLKIKFPTGTALQRFYAFPPILAPCTLTRHTPHDTHTHTHTHTHKVFLLWPKT